MIGIRAILAVTICAVGMSLSGCTSLTPVYGGARGVEIASLRFQYAEPTNRMEQIIYNELKLSFPASPDAGAPMLVVVASASSPKGALSNAISVGRQTASRVTATLTIGEGEDAYSVTRYNDAAYQSGALVLSEQVAAAEAEEIAARSTAAALRAAILATYGL